MEVIFLKAGNGDCIMIHNQGINILIDGGNESSYLLNEVNKIYSRKECIDLLIITHHDDDHIRGIIELLRLVKQSKFGEGKDFIKEVFFNSPRLMRGSIRESHLLSYKQAYEVENLLSEINTKWKKITSKSTCVEYNKLKLSFLSPTESDLHHYSSDPNVFLSGNKGDWNCPMDILDQNLSETSRDNCKINRSSIVILLEYENKKILLTGDVTPDRLECIIYKLFNIEKKLVFFSHIKMPHHGSHRNINANILSKIDCDNFIITTDGSKHYLPDKRAMLKIVRSRSKLKTNFIFNYRETIDLLQITPKEIQSYNLALFPNNETYGYVIR